MPTKTCQAYTTQMTTASLGGRLGRVWTMTESKLPWKLEAWEYYRQSTSQIQSIHSLKHSPYTQPPHSTRSVAQGENHTMALPTLRAKCNKKRSHAQKR